MSTIVTIIEVWKSMCRSNLVLPNNVKAMFLDIEGTRLFWLYALVYWAVLAYNVIAVMVATFVIYSPELT